MHHIANENRFESRIRTTVHFAQKQDLIGMLAILNINLISDKKIHRINKKQVEANGFLVGPFTADEIATHLVSTENHIILVAREEDLVTGYLISYDLCRVSDGLYKEFTSFPEIDKVQDKKKILYYRQVAKLPGKENIGSKLLQKMLDEAKEKGYEMVVCRVVHKPFQNKISIAFHKKFGFKFLGLVQNGDMTLGVYMKAL